VLDDVVVDTCEQQVVPNERVTGTASRQCHSACLSEPTVVDEPGAREGRERVDPIALRYPSRCELSVDLRGAAVSMTQGAERRLDGVVRRA
jgi:hypothetical protein